MAAEKSDGTRFSFDAANNATMATRMNTTPVFMPNCSMKRARSGMNQRALKATTAKILRSCR